MDTLFINDLTVNTTIGTAAWELAIKQPVVLNLSIFTKFDTENLQLNFDNLVSEITHFCDNNNFALLHTMIIKLEHLIIAAYPTILGIELSAKRLFAIANAKEIGIKIARSYPA